MEGKILAVDFDGSLAHYAFPDCGKPVISVVDAVRELKRRGWQVLIHSARVNSQWRCDEMEPKVSEMLGWLMEHRVPFDGVWGLLIHRESAATASYREDLDAWNVVEYNGEAVLWRMGTQTGKPVAHAYIDDRAVMIYEAAQPTGEIVAACEARAALARRQFGGHKDG